MGWLGVVCRGGDPPCPPGVREDRWCGLGVPVAVGVVGAVWFLFVRGSDPPYPPGVRGVCGWGGGEPVGDCGVSAWSDSGNPPAKGGKVPQPVGLG